MRDDPGGTNGPVVSDAPVVAIGLALDAQGAPVVQVVDAQSAPVMLDDARIVHVALDAQAAPADARRTARTVPDAGTSDAQSSAAITSALDARTARLKKILGDTPPAPAPAAPDAHIADDNEPLAADAFPPNRPAIMENIFDSMCTVPSDPAAKGLDWNRDLDWGRITRRTTAIGELGDMKRDLLLYELKGARMTYRFEGWIGSIGALHAEVGDLVVLCPDGRGSSMFTMPQGWDKVGIAQGFIRLSAPPAIAAFASLAPKHIKSSKPLLEARDHTDPTPGHFLIRSKAVRNTGTRWEMEDGWFLDVPAKTPGAKDMGTTRMWL